MAANEIMTRNKINLIALILIILIPSFLSFAQTQKPMSLKSGYAPVNGLQLYYEIHGTNQVNEKPLVLIHGGGSTIGTTFGRVLPSLAMKRQIIAVELQGHGHTADIDRPFTFEQDADDVAALLKHLNIESSDLFGFSNGGNTAMQIVIRHPELVNKLIVASSFFKREGMYPWFWDFMKNASIDNMPQGLKDAYLKINPDLQGLLAMHNKDAERMQEFKDWSDEDIKSIKAQTLIMVGDQDVVQPEHAVEMYRLIPNSRLVILPGKHGEYIGEIITADKNSKLPGITVSVVEEFLDEPGNEVK